MADDNLPIDLGPQPETPSSGTPAPEMETRDVLRGEAKIGELSMPAATTEEQWAAALSAYVVAQPASASPEEIVRANMAFGIELIAQFSAEVDIDSLDTQSTTDLITMLAPIQIMLLAGALGTAMVSLQQVPGGELIPQELLNKYVGKIQDYLSAQAGA